MLKTMDSLVLIIDIKEKLMSALNHGIKEQILIKAPKLVQAAKILGVNTLVTEQYPKGLGSTIEEIKRELPENCIPTEKTDFCALMEPGYTEKIKSLGKKQVIICGIEAHICVYQTAVKLLEEGYEVFVLKDLCASRNKVEFECAMDLLSTLGAKITCLEIVLFEWLKTAKNPNFKEIQALIK